MIPSEKKSDKLYLSKHGDEWHGKLVTFKEIRVEKSKELRGYKKNSYSFIAGKSLKEKDAEYNYLDITKHPSKNDSYIKLNTPINKSEKKSHIRKYVGTQKKKIIF